MRWRGRRQSDNVEDRRGQGAGFGLPGGLPRGMGLPRGRAGRTGGLGLGTVVLIVLAAWALGVDPSVLLGGGEPAVQREAAAPRSPAREEELKAFASTVLAETENTWTEIFRAGGRQYREPILVLFSGQIGSACGFASAASGPFYCPGDAKVYIDLAFFDQLSRQLRSPGDFAQAYVLAHEVGHHVQNLLGILPEYNRARQSLSPAEANRLSVRIELQADCLAGVWAHGARSQRDFLERGDIEEAMNAAAQIGDDTLQQRQGRVVPESFNHGTSEQRIRWFRQGLEEGRLAACDTAGQL
jgi:predicted metalloprotease